jgi:hypothetical protein
MSVRLASRLGKLNVEEGRSQRAVAGRDVVQAGNTIGGHFERCAQRLHLGAGRGETLRHQSGRR